MSHKLPWSSKEQLHQAPISGFVIYWAKMVKGSVWLLIPSIEKNKTEISSLTDHDKQFHTKAVSKPTPTMIVMQNPNNLVSNQNSYITILDPWISLFSSDQWNIILFGLCLHVKSHHQYDPISIKPKSVISLISLLANDYSFCNRFSLRI